MVVTVPSRIHAALLGVACGDALGAPLDGLTMRQARHQHGWVTEMRGDDAGGQATATGTNITVQLIAAARAAATSHEPLDLTNETPEDAPLARTLPVALAHRGRGTMLARRVATKPRGTRTDVCCTIYTLWIAELLDGAGMHEAWRHAIQMAQVYTLGDARRMGTRASPVVPYDVWRQFETVQSVAYEQLQPSGHASHATELLQAAAWCCLNARDIEETLILAANLAGNASAISAIAGGAAGTCYGEERVPRRWVERLGVRDELQTIGHALAQARAL